MNKRGQLVQTFEIVGTIIVIFLMCFVAQAFGSGQTFLKQYIAKDLALTADAFYINPGDVVSVGQLVEADRFSYTIQFAGDDFGKNEVWVKGGKLLNMGVWSFFRVENLILDQSYGFTGKNYQSFVTPFVFYYPHMLELSHDVQLEITNPEAVK